MNELHLHIIAFDIPYPPVYGGVIDVFYQIKTLSEAGVKIHLHAFEYGKGQRSEVLEKLCFSIKYYPRMTGLLSVTGLKPYIVASRKSKLLINELCKDNWPIMFEGLHCCYHLSDKRLGGRLKLFRATNIEHQYYANLALAERNIFHKIYFTFAALKLRYYQKVIGYADIVLPVSSADSEYFRIRFPHKEVITMHCFHANTWSSKLKKERGNFVLFHGNMEVAENERAAVFLMRKVMNDIDYPFIIAGNSPSKRLLRIASHYQNVSVIASPDDDTITHLISSASVNLLITFQRTGLKLKLLNALYKGSFVVANNKILHGTGLETLCYVADTAIELKRQVRFLINTKSGSEECRSNMNLLKENYDNTRNALTLIQLINARLTEKNDVNIKHPVHLRY